RHWVDEFMEHERIFCVVYDSDGRVRLRTEEMLADSVLPAPQGATWEPRHHDALIHTLGRLRVLEARLPLGTEDATVVLMTSLAEVDGELGRLLRALWMAIPVALVVSAGLGYLLARKALAPVEQLRRRTREITA